MLYAVILAGGSGTRLWPRSREQLPKQFLDLTGERTMLQEAVDRLRPLMPAERILVITNACYCGIVSQQVPDLPPENVIGEPAGRGTAPAIGWAAQILRRRDPDAVMAVLTADHLITQRERFRQSLLAAQDVARQGYLVTLGISPSHPETGYGYIERGEPLSGPPGWPVYRVSRFVEKPDLPTAEGFLRSGLYAWNSGMFIWRVSDILREIEKLMPDLYAQLQEIDAAQGAASEAATLHRVWPTIAKQTIDYGVMERADQVAVLPVDIGWNDVGSWAALLDLLPANAQGNVVQGEHLGVDTRDCLIYSPHRLIATIGLEQMIVVDTGDVVLICPKERSQDVRAIVDRLQKEGRNQLTRQAPAS